MEEQVLRQFLDDHRIRVTDFSRLLEFLREFGAVELDDLAQLKVEDLTDSASGSEPGPCSYHLPY